MIKFILLANTLVCPPCKTNIIGEMSKADINAYLEHQAQCLSTKHWPCLIEFVKKGEGIYSGKCGEMVKE